MVLEHWVSDTVVRLLATYLTIDPHNARLSLLSRELQLSDAQIKPDAVNLSLESSPLILREGTIGRLCVSLRPFSADAIHVLVDGLELLLSPRSADSQWWSQRAAETSDQERASALASLDPEGASAHAAAQQNGKQEGGKLTSRMLTAMLGALKIELRNAKVTVTARGSSASSLHSLCLGIGSCTLFEGFAEQGVVERGGLLGAAAAAIVCGPSSSQGALSKECHVAGVAIWLSSEQQQRDGSERCVPGGGAGSHEVRGSEPSGEARDKEDGSGKCEDSNDALKRSSQSGGAEQGRGREVPARVGDTFHRVQQGEGQLAGSMRLEGKGVEEEADLGATRGECARVPTPRFLLLPHEQFLEIRLRGALLAGLEMDVPSMAIQLDTADVAPLLEISAALLGPPTNHSAAAEPRQPSDDGESSGTVLAGRAEGERMGPAAGEGDSVRNGQEMLKGERERGPRRGEQWNPRQRWHRAVEKVLLHTSRANLAYALRAGENRRRYAVLYEAWLKEQGWGGMDAASARAGTKRTPKGKGRHKNTAGEMQEAERTLPVEAIVLARRIARRRALPAEHGGVVRPPEKGQQVFSCVLHLGKGLIAFGAGAAADEHGTLRRSENTGRSVVEESDDASNRTRSIVAQLVSWHAISLSAETGPLFVAARLTCGSLHGDLAHMRAPPASRLLGRLPRTSSSPAAAGGAMAMADEDDEEGGGFYDSMDIETRWSGEAVRSTAVLRTSSLELAQGGVELKEGAAASGPRVLGGGLESRAGGGDHGGRLKAFFSWSRWRSWWRGKGLPRESTDTPELEDQEAGRVDEPQEFEEWEDVVKGALAEEEGNTATEAGSPFLEATLRLDSGPGARGAPPSGLMTCDLRMGRPHLFVRDSSLEGIALLTEQLQSALAAPARSAATAQGAAAARAGGSSGTDGEGTHAQKPAPQAQSLGELAAWLVASCTAMVRDALLTAVPASALSMSMTFSGPRVSVFCAQKRVGGQREQGANKLEDAQHLTIDTGSYAVRAWPLQPRGELNADERDKLPADMGIGSEESERAPSPKALGGSWSSDSTASWAARQGGPETKGWDRVVEDLAWSQRPVRQQLAGEGRSDTFSDQTHMWNNLLVSVWGLEAGFAKGSELGELRHLLRPVAFNLSASLYRQRSSSLFGSSTLTSAAATLDLTEFGVSISAHDSARLLEITTSLTAAIRSHSQFPARVTTATEETQSSSPSRERSTVAKSSVAISSTSSAPSPAPEQALASTFSLSVEARIGSASLSISKLPSRSSTMDGASPSGRPREAAEACQLLAQGLVVAGRLGDACQPRVESSLASVRATFGAPTPKSQRAGQGSRSREELDSLGPGVPAIEFVLGPSAFMLQGPEPSGQHSPTQRDGSWIPAAGADTTLKEDVLALFRGEGGAPAGSGAASDTRDAAQKQGAELHLKVGRLAVLKGGVLSTLEEAARQQMSGNVELLVTLRAAADFSELVFTIDGGLVLVDTVALSGLLGYPAYLSAHILPFWEPLGLAPSAPEPTSGLASGASREDPAGFKGPQPSPWAGRLAARAAGSTLVLARPQPTGGSAGGGLVVEADASVTLSVSASRVTLAAELARLAVESMQAPPRAVARRESFLRRTPQGGPGLLPSSGADGRIPDESGSTGTQVQPPPGTALAQDGGRSTANGGNGTAFSFPASGEAGRPPLVRELSNGSKQGLQAPFSSQNGSTREASQAEPYVDREIREETNPADSNHERAGDAGQRDESPHHISFPPHNEQDSPQGLAVPQSPDATSVAVEGSKTLEGSRRSVASPSRADAQTGPENAEITKDGQLAGLDDRSIVKRLRASLEVHTVDTRKDLPDGTFTWAKVYKGRLTVSGAEMAITASEIQLLAELGAPFSRPASTAPVVGPSKSMRRLNSSSSQAAAPFDRVQELRDGCVVAIKDALACKFLAVEEIGRQTKQFRLVAEPHYSMAGDRALFQVCHTDRGKRGDGPAWFTLQSLHAISPSGVPFRLHHQPRSQLAGVASTGDGSGEQWRLEPYDIDSSAAGGELLADGGELSMYDCKHGQRAHLVNRKSGRGLAVMNGVPTLVKGSGHPLRFAVLAGPYGTGGAEPGAEEEWREVLQGGSNEQGTAQNRCDIEPPPEAAPHGGGQQGWGKEEHGETPTVRDGPAANSAHPLPGEPAREGGKGLPGHYANSREEIAARARERARVPHVGVELEKVEVTVLYEAGGGGHMLPLLRLRAEDSSAVAHVGAAKLRVFARSSLIVECYDSLTNQWGKMAKRIPLDLMVRSRAHPGPSRVPGYPKPPITVYAEVGKVEMLMREEFLDTLLFLIGTLELAGPYSIRHSPVAVNHCQVMNSTGLKLLCRFDQAEDNQEGLVQPRASSPFLIRHKSSRWDPKPTHATSTAVLRLQADDGMCLAPLPISLSMPGATATRGRILTGEGNKSMPGPTLVVDVSKQTKEGMRLTVSPLLVIRNNSGVGLELRFRRPPSVARTAEDSDGAVITLPPGETFDDAAVSFEALDLKGERRRVVSSLAVGNYVLSIRPLSVEPPGTSSAEGHKVRVEWSDDVSGARPVRVAGWMEELQRSFRQTMGDLFGRAFTASFGSIACKIRAERTESRKKEGGEPGSQGGEELHSLDPPAMNEEALHFMVRTTKREVRIAGASTSQAAARAEGAPGGSRVAWIAQQELAFLPTMRVRNLTANTLLAALTASGEGAGLPQSRDDWQTRARWGGAAAEVPGGGKPACMHAEPGLAHLSMYDPQRGYQCAPLNLRSGRALGLDDSIPFRMAGDEPQDLEAVFGDQQCVLQVRMSRCSDGILEASVFAKYTIVNKSEETIVCSPGRIPPGRKRGKAPPPEWTDDPAIVHVLEPGDRFPWLYRTSRVLLKRPEEGACPRPLDLESLSTATEIELPHDSAGTDLGGSLHLGVQLSIAGEAGGNPTRWIELSPRYFVHNSSPEPLYVCQDGFQDTPEAWLLVAPAERLPLQPGVRRQPQGTDDDEGPRPSPGAEGEQQLSVRFRPGVEGGDWEWSGPVWAASLGTFSVKLRGKAAEAAPSSSQSRVPAQAEVGAPLSNREGGSSERAREGQGNGQKDESKVHVSISRGVTGQVRPVRFAVADVMEAGASLVVQFSYQDPEQVPYRIENALRSNPIAFCQKGLGEREVLEPGSSMGYVWDDLGLPKRLTISVEGVQLPQEVNPDKVKPWRLFRGKRRAFLPISLNFRSRAQAGDGAEDGEGGGPEGSNDRLVGYEVYADGPTRVVRICEAGSDHAGSGDVRGAKEPRMELDVRVPLLGFTLLESPRPGAAAAGGEGASEQQGILYLQILRTDLEVDVTLDSTSCELKIERAEADLRWEGAPFVVLLRPRHESDNDRNFVHMAAVVNNLATDPRHLRYFSVLVQAVEMNLDEDTLMKLVPFARTRAAPYTGPPSKPIYFEQFEIHPIKIVAGFKPGSGSGTYNSAQETLRAMLHSVIKVPEVKGTVVELNGVLLTHALLSYTQLALKCAQHYSWYAMRAVYIARGSELLPPGFKSLFDDSAASSIDVFFDPANGSIDAKGLTLGMFNLLRKGLQRRGNRGSSRYLGDLEKTMKQAGSNLVYAVVTEVSDSVVKGVETSGVDGLLSGFRRGILKVAMEPSLLRTAVAQGGSTKRIRLDRSVGIDEVYVEGYLQAMLDTLFRQDYLRVKVSNDMVMLKNLPPNSTLLEEVMGAVRQFLVGEGLLAGESSAAAMRSLRRVRGEKDKRLAPAMKALCEQLAVILIVRALRRQTLRALHLKQPNRRAQGDRSPEDGPKQEPKKEPDRPKVQGVKAIKKAFTHILLSSVLAYLDGRLCRHIPHPLARRIVSGFLLSFVEM